MRLSLPLRPWALPALLVLGLCIPAGVAPSTLEPSAFTLPVPLTLGTASAQGIPAAAGDLLRASPVALPDAAPGTPSGWATLTLENLGSLGLQVRLQPGALAGPEGAIIPASALEVRGGNAEARLAPGETRTFDLRLHVPAPWEAYVPAGPYEGTLLVHAEVSP